MKHFMRLNSEGVVISTGSCDEVTFAAMRATEPDLIEVEPKHPAANGDKVSRKTLKLLAKAAPPKPEDLMHVLPPPDPNHFSGAEFMEAVFSFMEGDNAPLRELKRRYLAGKKK